VVLFDDPEAEVRAQAIKTVTDGYGRNLGLDIIPGPSGEGHSLTRVLIEKLQDDSLRVRQQALLGLGRVQDASAAKAILAEAAREDYRVSHIYTRHACVMAMAGSVPTEDLVALKDHNSDFVRACAVVALRRRGDSGVVAFFDDKDSVTAADAARAVHDDWMIPEAMPQLAAALGKQIESEGFTRRAINANFRLGDLESAKRVAAFVADGKAREDLLEAGLEALEAWSEPDVLDLVVGRHRALEPRDASIVAEAIGANIDALLSSEYASVRTAAMKAAREAKLAIARGTLLSLLENPKVSGVIRAEALRTLAAQGEVGLGDIVAGVLGDKADEVRMAGLELLVDQDSDSALEEIRSRVTGDQPVPVKQHAIRLLPKVNGVEAMTKLVGGLVDGIMAPPLQLDVLEAAKDPAFAEVDAITKPIANLEASWMAAMTTDPVMPYRYALAGGNAERGKSVFMNHAAAQCIRCHKVNDTRGGSNVGPNLKNVGLARKPEYILQALVDPQAVIAKGYGNISLTLKDGSTVAGVYRREDKKHVVIREVTNDEVKIPVEKIAERSPIISTMPPMGFIVDKGELRDLVAYMKTLQSEKK
ncbi:MAG: c-type cytochrome, partial [Verrucomicrobiales bacterium]|nr:c-type cytochrome [Verrucomicrobiales bacterium]